ncbi:MAG: hypothetical protein U0694_26400 [Anaerolineae bacterium]
MKIWTGSRSVLVAPSPKFRQGQVVACRVVGETHCKRRWPEVGFALKSAFDGAMGCVTVMVAVSVSLPPAPVAVSVTV